MQFVNSILNSVRGGKSVDHWINSSEHASHFKNALLQKMGQTPMLNNGLGKQLKKWISELNLPLNPQQSLSSLLVQLKESLDSEDQNKLDIIKTQAEDLGLSNKPLSDLI